MSSKAMNMKGKIRQTALSLSGSAVFSEICFIKSGGYPRIQPSKLI